MSPTQRSLKLMRRGGGIAGVVEKWIEQARKRQDLFGFVDIVAVNHMGTYGIQTTTGAHLMNRVRKIREDETLAKRAQMLLDVGWFVHIHGWSKSKRTGLYYVRIFDYETDTEILNGDCKPRKRQGR